MARFNPNNASPSRYANFADCPMKFWIFNLHPKASEFRNKGKSIGTVVDQTLHRFFSRSPDNRDEQSLKADFELVWLQERSNIREWCVLPSEETDVKVDAWQILKSFLNSFDTTKTPVYIPPLNGNPQKFDLLIKLDLGPDLLVQGWGDRLDKLGENYEVIDYKTKTGAELYEEKTTLQLRMYALLFDEWLRKKNLPGHIESLAFLYLTPRGTEKRSFSFTPKDKQDTISEIKALQTQIRINWAKYGENPWPCTCGTCSNLLAKMEERADEWAKGMNEPIQTILPTTQDIPF